MITFREWDVEYEHGRPFLHSSVMGDRWHGSVMSADVIPSADNASGIYSLLESTTNADWCKLPVWRPFNVVAIGAVDAYGAVVVHDDGTVRSQYARILALRLVRCRAVACEHDWIYLDLSFDRVGQLMFCPCLTSASSLSRLPIADFETFERKLLDAYGVPRLPDGVGPWEE